MAKRVEGKTYSNQLYKFMSDFSEVQLHLTPVPQDLAEAKQLIDKMRRADKPEHHNVYALLHKMMSFLSRTDKPTMSELSHVLSMPASSTKRMVDFLVDRGYCKRTTDPRDKRLVRISLTANGYKILRSTEQHVNRRTEQMLHYLSDDDRATLFSIFNKIATALKNNRSI